RVNAGATSRKAAALPYRRHLIREPFEGEQTMRSNFLARSRKWIGASALAILVGLGGGTAFLAASSPMAAAQVTPAAQITPPDLTAQNRGFADLVAAVKPAVVSITVEGREQAGPSNDFNGQIPDLPDDNPLKKFFQQFGDQFGPNGRPGPGQGPQGQPPQG